MESHMAFYEWLLSPGVMFLRFMLWHVSKLQPVLLPNNIPLYRIFIHSLVVLIHSLVDRHLGCFHFWAIMNNAAMNIHVPSYCVGVCFYFSWVYA